MCPPILLDQPADIVEPITPEAWQDFSQAVRDGLHGKWLKVTAATQASVTQVFYMNLWTITPLSEPQHNLNPTDLQILIREHFHIALWDGWSEGEVTMTNTWWGVSTSVTLQNGTNVQIPINYGRGLADYSKPIPLHEIQRIDEWSCVD